MAEILLSLTIIGVVAAITLPSLTGNINERTWNTQRKALYARMSQAISLMPALNGFGTITAASGTSGTDSYVAGQDNAAETFITGGLAKVLKINNVCDNLHLEDCGVVSKYTNIAGSTQTIKTDLYSFNNTFRSIAYSGKSYTTPNTKAVAFETQNGESIVAYYNRNCATEYLNQENLTVGGNTYGFPQSNMCVNFIYDLNGNKGPNTIGKDMGIMTVFNATDSIVVAPMPTNTTDAQNIVWDNAAAICTEKDQDARLPNIHEGTSMLLNKEPIALQYSAYWSSSLLDKDRAWLFHQTNGMRSTGLKTDPNAVRCIKR